MDRKKLEYAQDAMADKIQDLFVFAEDIKQLASDIETEQASIEETIEEDLSYVSDMLLNGDSKFEFITSFNCLLNNSLRIYASFGSKYAFTKAINTYKQWLDEELEVIFTDDIRNANWTTVLEHDEEAEMLIYHLGFHYISGQFSIKRLKLIKHFIETVTIKQAVRFMEIKREGETWFKQQCNYANDIQNRLDVGLEESIGRI